MVHSRILALVALVILSMAALPVAAVPAEPNATLTLTASADGFAVRTWSRYHVTGDNHNGEGLQVQNTADDFRRGYLQFDLSTYAGSGITQATLRLYKTAGPGAPTLLFLHDIDEEWTEGTLGITDTTSPWVWDRMPLITQSVAPANDVWVQVDVTQAANRALHGDSTPIGVLNLGLSTDAVNYSWGAIPLTFADRESAYPAELVITYNPSAPLAGAGPDQEVEGWTLGTAVQLDGSGSSDPNQGAESLYYSWTFMHIPGSSSLSSSDITPNNAVGAMQPSFTPDVYGVYTVRLQVRNNLGAMNTDVVTIDLTQALPAHPRVWLTAERLTDLRTRATQGETAWTRLRGVLDAHLGEGFADLYAPYNWMIQYALGYQIMLQSDPTAANSYADQAISLAQYVLDNDPDISADSWLYFGDAAAGLAIVYDWCYDRLSAEQRSALVAKMNEWVAEAYAMPPSILPDAYYAVEHRPDNNRYYAHAFGRTLVGLATLGENEPLAQEYVDAGKDQHRYEILPFQEQYGEGGGWSEGWNYVEGAMSHALLTAEAYRTVYGVDSFRESSFFYDLLPFLIHATLPDLRHGSPEGDMWETQAMIADLHRAVMLLLVNEFDDQAAAPQGQYWLENSTTVSDAHVTPGEMYDEHDYYLDFLWARPALPSADFTSLFPSYLADGTGLGFARSDWGQNATWVSLTCGGAPTDHLHQACGHVNLWRGEWLSADGNYGATNYGYNHEAYLHSLVTVNEQDVITGTGQAAYQAGLITRNGGSSLYSYTQVNVTPAMQYFDTNTGQYVTLASHYSREAIYLRPDAVVLLDRVRAADAGYFKRWQLNVPTQPTINGSTATATGTGGLGKLFVQSLLPAGATVSSVQLSDLNSWAGLTGWQVRVRPATQQADDLFLHILYAADAATPAMPAAVLVTASGGNMVGVHLAASPDNALALFSADPLAAPVTGPVVYSYTPTADTLHVLSGMLPATAYTITVQSAGGTQTITVAQGTGLISSNAGVLAVRITLDGQVIPSLYRVYLPVLDKGY